MKTFIISEIGINHSGDINLAKQLIKASKDSGADAVKFQKRDILRVYSKEELDKPRESPFGTTNREQKEGLEFEEVEYDKIDSYCKEIGIQWSASAWDLNSVEFLKKYDLKFNKIASALLKHHQLLQEVAKQKKLTYISTGMWDLHTISEAVRIFNINDCPFELLHCNSQYPMPDNEANLKCIPYLKDYFGCNVGYSCHSTGILPPSLAVALGATSIEKHITLDRASYGSDQAASVEPNGFHKMVEYIRFTEQTLGNYEKKVFPGEEKVKAKLAREKDY